jgi:hypothetical protein
MDVRSFSADPIRFRPVAFSIAINYQATRNRVFDFKKMGSLYSVHRGAMPQPGIFIISEKPACA